ncbi:hypothetical protein Hanom_Chr12g01097601 [Helianthus anomalus]
MRKGHNSKFLEPPSIHFSCCPLRSKIFVTYQISGHKSVRLPSVIKSPTTDPLVFRFLSNLWPPDPFGLNLRPPDRLGFRLNYRRLPDLLVSDMEDDEETHSHQSVGSGYEDSRRSNRRISVTLPSAAPLQMTLTLVLVVRDIVGGNGGQASDMASWELGCMDGGPRPTLPNLLVRL